MEGFTIEQLKKLKDSLAEWKLASGGLPDHANEALSILFSVINAQAKEQSF